MGSTITTDKTIQVPVKLKDIKAGDKVILSHEGVVTSVDTYSGHVRLKDGARIRMEKGSSWDIPANPILYTATREELPLPDFIPGQVWSDNTGETYYILNGYQLKAYNSKDKMSTLQELSKKPGLKLVFPGLTK